jgi:cell division protein ZapA
MTTKVEATIMGQPYIFSSSEEQVQELEEAIRYLDSKMCAIRASGKVLGNDRIAMMAAVGMAVELLSKGTPNKAAALAAANAAAEEAKQKISAINCEIERILMQASPTPH